MSEPPIGRVRGLSEPPAGAAKPDAPPAEPPAPAPAPAFTRPPAGSPPAPPQGQGPAPAPPRQDDEPPPRDRRRSSLDDEIDRAMDRAARVTPKKDEDEIALKRQWDDDLEAELAQAMEGFDAGSLDVAGPRTRAADRAHVPKGGVGQEDRPGPQLAKVLAIRGKTIFLDLGAKSEGIVPVDQFSDQELPHPGDMIEVVFDRFDAEEGLLIMSRRGAAVEASWENLRKGLVVEARVTKEIKGGLEVEVNGIRGFMPISQVDLGRTEDAKAYLNQKLKVQVTEANQRARNLVVSRRELLQREREEQREKTWADLEEGQVRKGVVRSIRDFGAFVDLGGVDGLLHISDLSWARTQDVGQLLKIGDELEVKVLRIDRAAQKVGLGLKQLMPSPWDLVEEKYHRGMTTRGRVTRLMDFGAFVELEPGVEGLVHISELSPSRVTRVKDIVQEGQEVEVRVLKIEPEARRISLSLRPLLGPAPEPEDDEPDDATPPPPRPERKVPLKGGLGDRDPDPFKSPPKGKP